MAQQTMILKEKRSSDVDALDEDPNKNEKKRNLAIDSEYFSCLLQPSPAHADPNYIGIRRLLLFRKAQSGVLCRKDWRCNGKGYVAYRNYINRPRNWESLNIPSVSSTPGNRLMCIFCAYAFSWLDAQLRLIPVFNNILNW